MDFKDFKRPQTDYDPDRVRGVDVPQASLEAIHQVLRTIHAGAMTQNSLATRAGISRRHANYRLQAGRILGLLTYNAMQLALTPHGTQLAELAPREAAAYVLWRSAIENCLPLLRLAPDLLAEQGPSRTDLTQRIIDLADLSHSTAKRRARELLNWRTMLLEAPDA